MSLQVHRSLLPVARADVPIIDTLESPTGPFTPLMEYVEGATSFLLEQNCWIALATEACLEAQVAAEVELMRATNVSEAAMGKCIVVMSAARSCDDEVRC